MFTARYELIKLFVFITEMVSVYYAVRTGSLDTVPLMSFISVFCNSEASFRVRAGSCVIFR